jgi:SAM-dependent methyltransferase
MLKGSIYEFTRKYLDSLGSLEGKTVVDVPAGQGLMSLEFKRRGAKVISLDLYPEKIQADVDDKLFVDMNSRFPIGDEVADIVICQEGIEHVPNQMGLMEELNRILKPYGQLIITSPSLSHMRARLSMLLVESEYWRRIPASEVDSVWFSEGETDRIDYGHFFLVNANQLRAITALTGFEIVKRIRTSISLSSVLMLPLLYPLIIVTTVFASIDSYRKNRSGWTQKKRKIYADQAKLNLSLVTLLCKDFLWVLKKRKSVFEVRQELKEFSRNSDQNP